MAPFPLHRSPVERVGVRPSTEARCRSPPLCVGSSRRSGSSSFLSPPSRLDGKLTGDTVEQRLLVSGGRESAADDTELALNPFAELGERKLHFSKVREVRGRAFFSRGESTGGLNTAHYFFFYLPCAATVTCMCGSFPFLYVHFRLPPPLPPRAHCHTPTALPPSPQPPRLPRARSQGPPRG